MYQIEYGNKLDSTVRVIVILNERGKLIVGVKVCSFFFIHVHFIF